MLLHHIGDHHAQLSREKLLFLAGDIAARKDRGDRRRIGRRAANALFLQRAHQRRLGIAGRRLREMLRGLKLVDHGSAALADVGERRGDMLVLRALVAGFFVDRGETGELEPLRARAQHNAPIIRDLDLLRLIDGVRHLAGDKAQIHQLIKIELIARERRLDILRLQLDVRRADSLVRVLRALAALVDDRLLRHILRAVSVFNRLSHAGNGLVGQADGVGTDVGDQTQRAASGNIHAFVELLGDLHGFAGGEAELAAGLLLQVRGRERRGRMLAALAALHASDREAALGNAGLGLVCLLLAGDTHALAVQAVQLGGELLAAHVELRLHMPVLLRLEGFNLLLAIDNHARGHALHAACAQALLDLHPQKRADLVAHQAVEHAARLLRVHQLHVDLARGFNRALDRLFRDLVEFHAAGALRVNAQNMRQMPGNRLALTVRVSRQNDGLGALGLLADALKHLAAAANGDIFGFEIVFNIDAQLGLGQIADVAI